MIDQVATAAESELLRSVTTLLINSVEGVTLNPTVNISGLETTQTESVVSRKIPAKKRRGSLCTSNTTSLVKEF